MEKGYLSIYCVKHNQHANTRGIWGRAPQDNFEIRYYEIESGGILGLNHNYKCIDFDP